MSGSASSLAFEDALKSVLKHLEDSSQHFIYLTGAAGTGKTTLIERVKEECSLKKMVVSPTGAVSYTHLTLPTTVIV